MLKVFIIGLLLFTVKTNFAQTNKEIQKLVDEVRTEFAGMIAEMRMLNSQNNFNIKKKTNKNNIEPVKNDVSTNELKPSEKNDSESNSLSSVFVAPINGAYDISSPYGYRIDPFTKKKAFHNGIDIPIATNSPIYASLDGIVLDAKRDRSGGKYILIQHDNGYKTLYAHLSRFAIQKGNKIKKGEIIGYSGNTGRSTGPHLHYEVYSNETPINPLLVLTKKVKCNEN